MLRARKGLSLIHGKFNTKDIANDILRSYCFVVCTSKDYLIVWFHSCAFSFSTTWGAWARPQWRTDVFFDSERKVREDSRRTVVSPLQSSQELS